jgi:hypothetical protein
MSWGEPGGHLASGRYARADFCRGFAGILQVKIRQQVSSVPILVPVLCEGSMQPLCRMTYGKIGLVRS